MANPKNVIWETGTNTQGGETLTSANVLKAEESQFYFYKTDGATADLPNVPDKRGVLNYFTYRVQNSGGYSTGRFGRQHWISFTGETWTRSYQNVSGRETWGEWTKTGAGGSSVNLEDYIKKPERQAQVQDLNTLTTSGLYRTDGEWGKAHPQSYPNIDNYWGTVIVMYENIGTQTVGKSCIQLFFAVHDTQNRLMHIRSQKTGQWSPWFPLSGEGGAVPTLPDEYFPSTDAQPITDANTFVNNGFKGTTSATTGLPTELDPEGKEGVIQFIQEHADGTGTGVQYYVPVQGKYAGTTFSRVRQDVEVVTRSGERQTQPTWSEWQSDQWGKIKIHNTRDETVPAPDFYRKKGDSKAGFIRHDWKMTSTTGLNLPQEEKGLRCMLSTYVPQPSDTQGTDYSDIYQIAYVIDGHIWKRQGNKTSNDWGNWDRISATAPPDYELQLKKILDKWIGNTVGSKSSFEDWYNNYFMTQKFTSWKSHQQIGSGKSQEQIKFEDYADLRYAKIGTGGTGPDFSTWTQFN